MLEQIHKHYSENDKISLLIRHADRDNIPTGEFGNDVLLNEIGKERALNFGNIETTTVAEVLASPVYRKLVDNYKSVELCKTCNMRKPVY